MLGILLVVEDEPHTLRFLTVVLEEHGYTVLPAHDGAHAVRLLTHFIPDLILSDIMMPVIDGIRLCQFVQSHPRYRAIPIILMSAFVEPLPNADSPPTAYLPKPFMLDQLFAVLGMALARSPERERA